MKKIINKDDWNRKKTFIKMIVENIQEKSSDQVIVNLFTEGMKDNYPDDIKLSESDIFLLYCKLLEDKRTSVIKNLRLIEELACFEGNYTYQTTYMKDGYNFPIHFPLLAYCIYNQTDWRDIAFIHQLELIANVTNMKIELKKSIREQLVEEPFLTAKESFLITKETYQEYIPYIMLGDVYVDFINKENNWDVNIREVYKNYPQQVSEYLENMAKLFILAIQPTPGDDSEKDQDWLRNYAKALRNMTEKVIEVIRAQKKLEKQQRHDALGKISKDILLQLDACDKNSFEALDKKASSKLMEFIASLRKHVNKVSSVEAYTNTQFFTQTSSSLIEENKIANISQIEEKTICSPQNK